MSDVDPAAQAAMQVLGRYIGEFRAAATQLNDHRAGGDWFRLRKPDGAPVTAIEAAAWANQGFTPHEAAAHIAAGATPETASAE